jgi:effector-binding domain-containing protein
MVPSTRSSSLKRNSAEISRSSRKAAEILHLGPYAAERPTTERLLAFIREQGYKVDGPHEEEYLSRPDARVPKTLIRYRIRRSTQK